jgi:ATP-dependent DNA helicase RecQ
VADAGTDDIDQLVEQTGPSRNRVTAALNCLGDGEAPAVAAARAHAEREARARIQQSRVDMMRAYAEARGCRRQVLLNYFGEPLDDPCGNCDRCAAGPDEADASGEPFPFTARSPTPPGALGRSWATRATR